MNLKLIRIVDYYFGIPIIQLLRPIKLFRRSAEINENFHPKKILLIKFFGLGNLILSSPVLKKIKDKFPGAEMHYLTLSSNRGILECYKDYVKKPVYLDMKGINLPMETFKILKMLRKEKYDQVIDLDQFSRYSAIISFLANPKVSLGYKTKDAKRHYLYDKTAEYRGSKHVTEEFVDILKPFGIASREKIKLLPLKTGPQEKRNVEKWLNESRLANKKIIGVHIGVGENAPQRKWPYFKELVEEVLKKTGFYVVLTAGPKEYEDCESLIKSVGIDEKIKDSRIKITKGIKLAELPYLMEKLALFISNDTGPLHMAAAQGKAVIGLYGPNTPALYGPYTDKKIIFYKRLKCSPCITNFNNKETICGNPVCVGEIRVSEVFEAIMRVAK